MSEFYETMSDDEDEIKYLDSQVIRISYKIQEKKKLKTKYELLIKNINRELETLKIEERAIHKTYKDYEKQKQPKQVTREVIGNE